MDIRYGLADMADAEEIISFQKELVNRYENLENIQYEKVMGWLARKVRENIGEYTRIYAGEELAGFYRFHPEDGKMELDDLYLYPSYRGKGIGTAVIQKCLIETDQPVFLYVFAGNTGALRLYQRLGFQIVQTVHNTRYRMEYQKDKRSC